MNQYYYPVIFKSSAGIIFNVHIRVDRKSNFGQLKIPDSAKDGK